MRTPKWIREIYNPDVSSQNHVPVYEPIFTGNEKKYLLNCIDKTWISPKGNYVSLFEKSFSQAVGCKYAIACSSGTAALHLSLLSQGVKFKDEVVVPTFTMISTALAVSYIGAELIFADCDINTGNLDVADIDKYISKKTKAIIPVDIYGCPCNYDELIKFSGERNIVLIEDAAESLGSSYKNIHCGNICDVSAFSLYINKVITTGQGGMITTNSRKTYNELREMNNYYFSPKRHFWHRKIGYNYRLSNLQAAVGLAQIEKIDKILEKKKQLANWYNSFLSALGEFLIPMKIPPFVVSNHWQVAYRVREEKYNVMKLRVKLAGEGIETRSFFIPLHLQPAYFKKEYIGKFPNSEMLAKTGLLLPSGPTITEEKVERICRVIADYFIK